MTDTNVTQAQWATKVIETFFPAHAGTATAGQGEGGAETGSEKQVPA